MRDRPRPDETDRDDTFHHLLERRLTRRTMLGGMLGAALSPSLSAAVSQRDDPSTLAFEPLPNRLDRTHHVAPGYDADVLVRWGDPILEDAPPFDVAAQSSKRQERQFGYDNDFIAFMPLPRGSNASDRGLLCVNHEYSRAELMRPMGNPATSTREEVRTEMAAQGHAIVEVAREKGTWRVVQDGECNRRITAYTPIAVSGPAAGHARMKTAADPTGKLVLGTFGNCAGGVTPWGTVLTAEENFHAYFVGDPTQTAEARNHRRYSLGFPTIGWGRHEQRFFVNREPNEPNRFGWIVEIDPYDPTARPIKRTALGRCKHEGACVVTNADGRIVVYTGDDEAFEYLYRFVSDDRFDPEKPEAARDLLDHGTLSVAKFSDEKLEWLPLVFGEGPLTKANGFDGQGEVLIDTRRAADLLGATRLDRPEDIEMDPKSGAMFVAMTRNTARQEGDTDAASPRAVNLHGHIVRFVPPTDENGTRDHAANEFTWDVFLLGGNPADATHGAKYHPDVDGDGGWISAPDNLVFDRRGRLWIATDQGPFQALTELPDGIRACDVRGDGSAYTKLFFTVPIGAEATGPCFTPDNTTMFVSVQHPGEGSRFEAPATRWPDFDPKLPPRPSVVAIQKRGGGTIG